MGSQASSLTSTRHRSPLARHLHLVVIPAKSRALTFDVCGLCHRTIPCTTFVLLYFCTFVLCTTFVSPYYSVPLLYFCTFVLCTLFYFCVTALLCTTFAHAVRVCSLSRNVNGRLHIAGALPRSKVQHKFTFAQQSTVRLYTCAAQFYTTYNFIYTCAAHQKCMHE